MSIDNQSVWLAVGGAVSVDKAFRAEGKTWFAGEELSDEEAQTIIAGGPADVVVSHDAPLGVPFLRGLLRQNRPAWRRESEWPTGLIIRSDEHQRRVRRVVDGVAAKPVFHVITTSATAMNFLPPTGPVGVERLGMDLDPLAGRCNLVDGSGRLIHPAG